MAKDDERQEVTEVQTPAPKPRIKVNHRPRKRQPSYRKTKPAWKDSGSPLSLKAYARKHAKAGDVDSQAWLNNKRKG